MFNAGVVVLSSNPSSILQVNKSIANNVFPFYCGSNFVCVRTASTVGALEIEAKMLFIRDLSSPPPLCVSPPFQCFFFIISTIQLNVGFILQKLFTCIILYCTGRQAGRLKIWSGEQRNSTTSFYFDLASNRQTQHQMA